MFVFCFFHFSQVSTPPKPAAKQPKVKTPNSEEGAPPADGDGNEGIYYMFILLQVHNYCELNLCLSNLRNTC